MLYNFSLNINDSFNISGISFIFLFNYQSDFIFEKKNKCRKKERHKRIWKIIYVFFCNSFVDVWYSIFHFFYPQDLCHWKFYFFFFLSFCDLNTYYQNFIRKSNRENNKPFRYLQARSYLHKSTSRIGYRSILFFSIPFFFLFSFW